MTMQNDINDVADALESVKKKRRKNKPKRTLKAADEVHVIDEETLESRPPPRRLLKLKQRPRSLSRPLPSRAGSRARTRRCRLKDQLVRLAADFENFKKRTRREKDIRKFANEQLLKDILPPLDNLNRALAHVEDRSNPLVQGIEMVAKQFLDILGVWGNSREQGSGIRPSGS